jgi:hypothetical protein
MASCPLAAAQQAPYISVAPREASPTCSSPIKRISSGVETGRVSCWGEPGKSLPAPVWRLSVVGYTGRSPEYPPRSQDSTGERDIIAETTLSGSPSCTIRGACQNLSELAADRIEHPPDQSLPHLPNDLALGVRQVVETSERAVGFLSGELHSESV